MFPEYTLEGSFIATAFFLLWLITIPRETWKSLTFQNDKDEFGWVLGSVLSFCAITGFLGFVNTIIYIFITLIDNTKEFQLVLIIPAILFAFPTLFITMMFTIAIGWGVEDGFSEWKDKNKNWNLMDYFKK